eukprot:TRINITY_DN50991_c0_g1_i1.p1 TRINITY_DN50991_c0_g1~~TRINITY_DN50991_c0_g1_i1.p1  ORF type:complete len:323 (-),score=30.31 TRINITY_DN50991_c0_g1_i1:146-1072(-)
MAVPPAAASGSGAIEAFGRQGWQFEANIRPLTRSDEIDEIASREKLCKVPDMFCGGAYLRLKHAVSSTVLELNISDALLCSRWDPLPHLSLVPSLDVFGAAQEDAKPLEVPLLGIVRCQFADRWRPQSDHPDVRELRVNSCWTCSTPYWGTTYRGLDAATSERIRLDGNAWEATEDTLPMDLLRQQDEIGWYQEILFWEDELGDNGLCRLSVRVRVMPSFWFVLFLCEMRVDNVMLREVATRLFCSFDSDSVLREWTWKEASYETLKSRGINVSENPQISHASIGTTLMSEKDVRKRVRHRLNLPKTS